MPQGDTSCTGTHMPALPARGSNIYAAGGIQSKLWVYNHVQGFPGSSDGNESACNAGDLGLIPVSGRSPGGGNGSPLQYSCLEEPMDRGAWRATVHEVTKSRTRPKQLNTHAFSFLFMYFCPLSHQVVCFIILDSFYISVLADFL